MQPKNYEAAIGLGVALRGNKKIDEAEAQYNAAQKLDSANPSSYFNLGLLYQDYKGGEKPVAAEGPGVLPAVPLARSNGSTPDTLKREAEKRIKDIDEIYVALAEAAKMQAEAEEMQKKAEEQQKKMEEEMKKQERPRRRPPPPRLRGGAQAGAGRRAGRPTAAAGTEPPRRRRAAPAAARRQPMTPPAGEQEVRARSKKLVYARSMAGSAADRPSSYGGESDMSGTAGPVGCLTREPGLPA